VGWRCPGFDAGRLPGPGLRPAPGALALIAAVASRWVGPLWPKSRPTRPRHNPSTLADLRLRAYREIPAGYDHDPHPPGGGRNRRSSQPSCHASQTTASGKARRHRRRLRRSPPCNEAHQHDSRRYLLPRRLTIATERSVVPPLTGRPALRILYRSSSQAYYDLRAAAAKEARTEPSKTADPGGAAEPPERDANGKPVATGYQTKQPPNVHHGSFGTKRFQFPERQWCHAPVLAASTTG